MATTTMIPFNMTLLRDDLDDDVNSRVVTTLNDFRDGKVTLIDFWNTTCTRCPSAIEKINKMASDNDGDVLYMSICMDNADLAEELIDEMEWENMTHAFIDLDTKEELKAALGMKYVPFVALIGNDGVIDCAGPPKNFDLPERINVLKNTILPNESMELNEPISDLIHEKATIEITTENYVFSLDEDF